MVDVAHVIAQSPWAGRSGLRWRPGAPPVASPMCQAVDWSNVVVADDGRDALFLKIAQPDMAGFVDIQAAYLGAVAGRRAGIAPNVEFFLPHLGAIGFSYLAPPWRSARLDDLARPSGMQAAIAAKKALRRGPPLPRDWDVFARVREAVHLAETTGTVLPADLPMLVAQSDNIGTAVAAAGRDSAPCHNDGQASNIMLGPDGHVLLVDFDCAGQADPHYDLGVLLNEAYMFEQDWRAGIEMHDGRCGERVLNRCRAYAVADDLLWGLWGLILSATSPRRDLEFLKFGEWRLLRCRMALREQDFSGRLHRL